MKVIDFISQQGFYFPIVNCKIQSVAEEILEGPDVGMLCAITSINRYPNYDEDGKKAYKVYLDYSRYEEYNKAMAIPNFYDNVGNPTLTWFQSKMYRDTDELIIYDSDEIEDYFSWDHADWSTELNKVGKCSQRQDSTVDQLRDLIAIANKFGFYDAADYVKSCIIHLMGKEV